MDCFVQNVILFHCNEKLLCKMHLCKIDFWLIWVIFQDMIRRMIRRAMFPVYSRVIKAWLASSCAPLLLLHQRPVLFCVCFKKFKHIGLEGGWAGLGWAGLAPGFRSSPGWCWGFWLMAVTMFSKLTADIFIQLLLKKKYGRFSFTLEKWIIQFSFSQVLDVWRPGRVTVTNNG